MPDSDSSASLEEFDPRHRVAELGHFVASLPNLTCAQCPGLRTPECCFYRTQTEDMETILGKRHRSNYSHEDVEAALIFAPNPPSEDELSSYLPVRLEVQDTGGLAEDGGEGLISALLESGNVEHVPQEVQTCEGHKLQLPMEDAWFDEYFNYKEYSTDYDARNQQKVSNNGGDSTLNGALADDGGEGLSLERSASSKSGHLELPGHGNSDIHSFIETIHKQQLQMEVDEYFNYDDYFQIQESYNDVPENLMQHPAVHQEVQQLDLQLPQEPPVGMTHDLPASEADQVRGGSTVNENILPETCVLIPSPCYEQQHDNIFGSGGMGIAGFQMSLPGDTSAMSGTPHDSGIIDNLPRDADHPLVRFRPETGKYVAEVRVREWNAVNKKIWVGSFVSGGETHRAVDMVQKFLQDSRGSSSQTIPPHGFLLSDVSCENIKRVRAYCRDLVESARRSGALTAT